MTIKKLSTILILSVIALCGCTHKNDSPNETVNSDVNLSVDVSSQNDVADVNDDNAEVYYCDIVNDCVSKYPELSTTDVVINEYGFGPMIVSPYADDEVVKAVAHVIYDTNIEAYCFGNYLFDKYSDDFTECDYDEVYEIIKNRVEEARVQADIINEKLIASIEEDSAINISPDGEYYYLLDMENFEESVSDIQASIDRQSEIFDFDMQFYCEYYFSHDGRTFIGGYRGPTYAIYLDNYSADNKIYEYYYWKSKHDWVDIYTDLYISQIYDYTKISEKLDVQSDYGKQLNCSSSLYQNTDTGLYEIRYTYRMFSDDFDLSEATELAYEVYTNVCSTNVRYNTNKICGIYIDINNFIEYEKEYNQVQVYIPFDEEYSLEEFEDIIEDNIEINIDSEPE
jgi:hypothetical protein